MTCENESFVREEHSMPICLKLSMDAFSPTLAEFSNRDRLMACRAQNIYRFRMKKHRLQEFGPTPLVTHSPNASCQNIGKTAPSSNLV